MSEFFRNYIRKDQFTNHPSNIKFKTNFRNCVLDACKRRQWKETEGELDWDIIWADKEWIHEVFDHVHLQNHQRVNHYRNYGELCRKDLLVKNLKRYKKQLQKDNRHEEAGSMDFFPITFNMPGEYSLFVEEFKRNPNTVWIMKPIGKSQGKGIFLFTRLGQVTNWRSEYRWKPDNPQAEPYIVQRYVHNPLLIGGKKFDLRMYVLVTNYNPLTVYQYRTGFARFTHHRYSSNPEDLQNQFIHLTNVAIQKSSNNYDENLGGKWDVRKLKLFMMTRFGQEAVSQCFNSITNIFIRSLQSVQRVIINDKHSFELYGYDILIDSELKPWIIEVNASPSMTANTQSDWSMKVDLLDDTFTVLDLEKVLQGNETQIGGFDLIYRGQAIAPQSNSLFQTNLGCQNNRKQQLRRMAKQAAQRLQTKT